MCGNCNKPGCTGCFTISAGSGLSSGGNLQIGAGASGTVRIGGNSGNVLTLGGIGSTWETPDDRLKISSGITAPGNITIQPGEPAPGDPPGELIFKKPEVGYVERPEGVTKSRRLAEQVLQNTEVIKGSALAVLLEELIRAVAIERWSAKDIEEEKAESIRLGDARAELELNRQADGARAALERNGNE